MATKKREDLINRINEIKASADTKTASLFNEIIAELSNEKKYGLVWDRENTIEDVVKECINNIPVLEVDETKTIQNGGQNNVLIEGDNFHSLLALNMIAKESVDVIYIDPPYNTGHEDFVYNDNYVGEDDGYKHSKWLNFMEKRLKLAKDLLKNDGLIFISIDDNEQANIKLLCDEIFGQRNLITQFVWEKTQHFGRQKINYYSNCEYILCYAKQLYDRSNSKLKELIVEKIKTELTDAPLFNASNNENVLIFPIGKVSFNIKDGKYTESSNDSYKLMKEVFVKDGRNSTELILKFKSRWSQKTIDEEITKGTTFWVKSDGFAIRAVYHEGKTSNSSPKQLVFSNFNNPLCAYDRFGNKVGVNEEGSKELNNILENNVFAYPKPVSMIKYLISMLYNYSKCEYMSNYTVLDFFAGSGTTGQAVLELNKEDGGNRRFILCTNNENNICEDITYQRLKTVITGKRKDKSKYSDGLEGSLYYLKTKFVKNHDNSDQAKYNLSDKLDALICIKEDIFKKVTKNKYYSHYSNDKNHLFIYNDYYNEDKFNEFINEIKKTNEHKIIYLFSVDNSLDESLFDGLDDLEIKTMPSKSYEIYKEIIEEIKNKDNL